MTVHEQAIEALNLFRARHTSEWARRDAALALELAVTYRNALRNLEA